MLIMLSLIAGFFFLSHVILLIAAFWAGSYHPSHYFYSHLTLWITGLLIFILALCFQGQHVSGFLEYFDTAGKKAMILLVTFCLSLLAHTIVTSLRLTSKEKVRK